MPKILSPVDFEKESKNVSPKYLACSFNKKTEPSSDTKLIIVGTLTPPDTAYFYCSFFNRIYGYIDEALKDEKLKQLVGNGQNPSLKELKRGLSRVRTKRIKIDLLPKEEIDKRVKAIEQILKDNKIAFLDVMDKAIRKNLTSYDDDIEFFTLAYDDFKNIKPGTVIIANSKLAYECCLSLNVKAQLLSQRCDTKKQWVDAIVAALIES